MRVLENFPEATREKKSINFSKHRFNFSFTKIIRNRDDSSTTLFNPFNVTCSNIVKLITRVGSIKFGWIGENTNNRSVI